MARQFVITHPEWGVYLGNCLGLGFWTLVDSAGQPAAVLFGSEAQAEAHIRSWDQNNDPADYTLHAVEAAGQWASAAELRAAGLGDMLGDMEENALLCAAGTAAGGSAL
ncbi:MULTISPECIES: hypothetical protein [unclassified Xanthobacter]|uniref:hypothetical protein n=1 Tax=unclassified Xanthobacter TaxID=2623496 RepID=UPI001F3C7E02|nr:MULTISPECIES: hypothetical protein [unclassified Xanthobacter]